MEVIKEITVSTTIQAPVEKVWKCWTEPKHIPKWNSASEDWHTPFADNDLRVGGKFKFRMEAKDGSVGFDMTGIYEEVNLHEVLAYVMEDGRKVKITFNADGDETEVIETFEAESTNPIEFQQQGWQAILNKFKTYVEKTEI